VSNAVLHRGYRETTIFTFFCHRVFTRYERSVLEHPVVARRIIDAIRIIHQQRTVGVRERIGPAGKWAFKGTPCASARTLLRVWNQRREMTDSRSTGQNELSGSTATTREQKRNWEREHTEGFISALMGDPFPIPLIDAASAFGVRSNCASM
jgi:hypothetical protein